MRDVALSIFAWFKKKFRKKLKVTECTCGHGFTTSHVLVPCPACGRMFKGSLVVLIALIFGFNAQAYVYVVKPHITKTGKLVGPYIKSSPNQIRNDNLKAGK